MTIAMSNEHAAFPLLKTERLELVEVRKQHAGDLYRLYTDERVTKYYTVYPFKAESDLYPIIESFSERFNAGTGIRWGIALAGHEELIGSIGYQHISAGHKATIMFAISPDYQNNGYMSEALKAVIQYGFDVLALKRIEAEVIPGNTASDAVLAKAGFSFEGLLRSWMMWDRTPYDMKMFSLISPDSTTL